MIHTTDIKWIVFIGVIVILAGVLSSCGTWDAITSESQQIVREADEIGEDIVHETADELSESIRGTRHPHEECTIIDEEIVCEEL